MAKRFLRTALVAVGALTLWSSSSCVVNRYPRGAYYYPHAHAVIVAPGKTPTAPTAPVPE